jgi:hypothetical protein
MCFPRKLFDTARYSSSLGTENPLGCPRAATPDWIARGDRQMIIVEKGSIKNDASNTSVMFHPVPIRSTPISALSSVAETHVAFSYDFTGAISNSFRKGSFGRSSLKN